MGIQRQGYWRGVGMCLVRHRGGVATVGTSPSASSSRRVCDDHNPPVFSHSLCRPIPLTHPLAEGPVIYLSAFEQGTDAAIGDTSRAVALPRSSPTHLLVCAYHPRALPTLLTALAPLPDTSGRVMKPSTYPNGRDRPETTRFVTQYSRFVFSPQFCLVHRKSTALTSCQILFLGPLHYRDPSHAHNASTSHPVHHYTAHHVLIALQRRTPFIITHTPPSRTPHEVTTWVTWNRPNKTGWLG